MDFVLQFERKILQDGMHIFHNTQSKSAMRERNMFSIQQKRTLVLARRVHVHDTHDRRWKKSQQSCAAMCA